jgi:hypothetical protein
MPVNSFDVLKKMADDNLDIRLGVDVVQATKCRLGTQVTMGIAGDVVGSLVTGELIACLLLYNRKQFNETKEKLGEMTT